MICDPWLEGVVFNNGWDLLARSRFEYDDFRDITHIWFSHEHPDHFYPSNVRKIPREYRERITVLFQETLDKQVVDFCREVGFKEVIELSPDEWHELAPGLSMLCCPCPADWGECDSWMCLKTEDLTLLNVNDCAITGRMAKDIRGRVGAVDVLLTQFSYASWVGNADDVEQRRDAASSKLRGATEQIHALQPRCVIPFASFVWFCHEENFFMNETANRIADVAAHFRAETDANVLVMYPGDTWVVGEECQSEAALDSWQKEYDRLESRPRHKTLPVTRERLLEASETHIRERRRRINPLVAHLCAVAVVHPLRGKRRGDRRGWLAWFASLLFAKAEPARLWVSDHQSSYELDSQRLRPVDLPRDRCDVELSAESLLFCFLFPWGCETLQINGRYRPLYESGQRSLCGYFKLGRILHHGHSSLLAEVMKTVLRRVKLRLLKTVRSLGPLRISYHMAPPRSRSTGRETPVRDHGRSSRAAAQTDPGRAHFGR